MFGAAWAIVPSRRNFGKRRMADIRRREDWLRAALAALFAGC
jgi:hypothetical protein